EPGLGYDLGMVQQLYDLHELGPGGGELTLDGVWHWQYSDGLDFDLGILNREGGHYFIQLDAAGTGLMAIPEPGTFALLAFGLLGLLAMNARRRRFPV
ncbi:MAG: PEP-CTERM sorting domain-containing protein, partial [Thermoguttaceae bacterium]|nr:PEP-CTERM sorting domain-containing protein [Thermoguttaceae bacterium]